MLIPSGADPTRKGVTDHQQNNRLSVKMVGKEAVGAIYITTVGV